MKPLEDVRVLSIEQFGAGPFGTLHLADLGAEVIKIEDPVTGGDVGRYVPPFAEGEDSLFFEAFNRNKRSLSLDLTSPAGRAVFEDLVRVSDVVFSNLRGDVPEKLCLRYADLAPVNERIVCVSLSGYGMSGPRRADPAYDYVLQAMSGWMDLTGEPDGPPTKSGLSLVDYIGGIVAALAAVSAVHQARRDGRGTDCDVSLFDAAISMLTYPAIWQLNGGFDPQRLARSAHPSLVPFQLFVTADGWIVIACAKEKFFGRLAEAIGQPALATDERFSTFDARRVNREALTQILDAALLSRSTTEWLETFGSAGVPCGPVNSVAEALSDPHTDARGMIVETEHPRFGVVRQAGTAARVGDERVTPRRAPSRNEDADYLLRDVLRYDDDRVAALTEQGAFGGSTNGSTADRRGEG